MSLHVRTGQVIAAAAMLALAAEAFAGSPADDWRAAAEAWRVKQEQSLRSADGWLTVAGLFFLRPGVNTIGADSGSDVVLPEGAGPAEAGRLTLTDGVVRFEPAAGVAASLNQQPVIAPVELRLPSAAEKRPADRVTIGRIVIHLHRSGARLAIRLRDPESALRKQFTGLRWFPLEERWRVHAAFVRYDTPRTVTVQNVLGDVEESSSIGEAVFEVDGQPVRLVAFKAGERLSFVFRDATAAADTYRIRFLSADAPDSQGRVLLDFNRAYNPPCAYNPHTTCPLPVPQNRLKVAIPAGEKRYLGADSTHPTADGEQP
jgi:uncharacterized protein (DUF1684 family)